ncbi:hypothetical protein [Frigoriglobus tundricola]|uniref:Uncharacterized protein n=1 Tax=Frigoriglobus tundricola TaxID=2774151 RepID=A0A6M5YM86_9BACT|nr:hypothetical protein [Frigoriglobus tundricola]QJW94704.1 hypothetical protein FTUN_2226 [Frigoriglobus tundricola]
MMTMGDYLTEIEYAASSLIPIIWEERHRLQKLEMEVASLTRLVEDNYRRAASVAMNSEDADDAAMAAGIYWENYFGDDKERYHKDQDREKLANQIAAHALSIGSLAGSLMQYAKQGISLAHGGLPACPNGRAIGSQFLKDVIWQGRNQAIHWEDGNPHPPVRQCFDKLKVDAAPAFADYTKRNMAVDVVELLGWTDFAKFSADLLSLA